MTEGGLIPLNIAASGTLTYAAGATNPASLSADLTTGYATTFSAAAGANLLTPLPTPVNDTVNEEHETFTITINAGTGYVLGTPTTTTVTITDNDPPAAPSGLSLTAGSGKLSASWTKPTGPVTGYQLRHKQTTATDQTATTSGDPSTGWVTSTASITTTSGEITGLTNGTAYDVQVRATDGQTGTGNGYGAWSASRSGTPAAAASTDATLSALTASSATSSGGSYSSLNIGTFASGTTSYTATVANTVTHVKLTPTVNDSDATVKVGKGSSLTTVSSGSASSAIALAVGSNALTVTVTAEDGTTTKSYTVTVTRGQSNDATLSGLTVTGSASAGGTYAAQTLSPAFAASTDLYTVNVAKDISHVKLNATTTDSGATMKVLDVTGNDVIGSLAGGTASRALPVNPDRNILVLRVTAADGTTKDHYVYVQRAAIPRNLCVEVGAHPNGSPMLLISIQDAEIDTTITYSEAVQNGVAENLRQFFQVKRSVDASWPARAGSDNWPAGSQADGNIEDGSGGAVIASCGGVDGTVLYDLSEPGVTYNVRAHHVNENTFAAYGESTPVKTVTTWNLPGKPTSVSATAVSQDHTKLRVAWSAPASTGGTGAQITGYKVRWRVKDADGDTTGDQPGDWNNDDGVAATGTTHDATGLSAATEYEVQVRALNGINPGSAWSDAASGTTGRPSPAQAPTNLVVTAGDSKLDLYWTASSGAVTGYDVHYTTAAAGTVSNDAAASGNDPAAAWVALTRSGTTAAQTISSLSNGTAYRVRVRGKNSVGNSNWVLGTGTPAVISNDATLSALTASSATSSGGSYSSLNIGTFASGTTSYTATVANTVTHVKLTPTVNDSGASVTVNGNSVAKGSPSGAIALAVGSNALTVEVTAEDGAATQSYTVTVTRQAAVTTTTTPTPDPDPDPDPSGGNTPPPLPQEEITPPPQEIRPPLVVSVMGGEAVTEGEAARFTLSVNPPPVAGESISVAVTVSDSGDFAAPGATGARTVTLDEGGTASFSVATQDDALYEDDGAITATVVAGDGYIPSSSNNEDTATVKVENNDPAVILSSPTLTISGGSSSSYTMRLPQEPTAEVSVDIITVIITVEPEPQALNQQGSGGGAEGNSLEPSYFAAAAGEATALSLPVVVQPSRLLFSPSDWDRPQRVTVTIAAPRSSGAPVTTATLIHRPSGGGYSGAAPVEMQLQVVAPPPPTEETTAGKAAQRAWHLRAGRTLSQQVVDALQHRFTTTTSSTPSGLQLTVAGQDLTGDTPWQENHLLLSRLLGFENLSSQEVAHGSSFSFSTDGTGPRLSFWGKGAFSSFNGVEDTITLTGDVTTALLAAEWSRERWRAGAALSHSWGNGSYQGEGDGANGRISSTVTGVFPYGRYALTPRLGVWATAGYGWGNLSLNPDGDGSEYNPATTMALGAVGMDGLLLDGGSEGITLTTTADALFLKTGSEAVEGLASSEGNITRLRLGLEATRPFPLANGASLSPSLEVGLRQDSGDAETGFGMDLGAGLSWNDPERGVTAAVKGRTLLSHGAEDFQDQGLALSFSWQPSPSNRGASLSLSHAVGLPAEGGMAALLNPTAIEVLDEHNSSGERFEAKLAYGFPFYNDRLTLSPAVALALSTSSRTYSLLWSLAPYDEHLMGEPWQLSLEGERHENLSSPTVDHSLKLRFALPL